MVAAIFVGAVSVVMAAILAVVTQHFRESLKQEKSRKILGERLSHPVYFGLLKGRLDWLEQVFGPTMGIRPFRFGGKGLGICLFFALCYALVSFVIGWMLGAPGTLGEITMFVDDGPLAGSWPRPVRGIAVLLFPFVGFLIFRWTVSKAAAWVARRSATGQRSLMLRSNVKEPVAAAGAAAGVVVIVIVAAAAVAVAVGAPSPIGVAVLGAVIVIGAVGGGVYGPRAFFLARGVSVGAASAFAIVSTIVVAIVVAAVAIRGAGPYPLVGMILFFILLPLLNGFWDWGSLSLSRRLGRDILEKKSAASALGLAVVDLIAAVGFLVSLVVVLPFIAGALERLTAVSLDLAGYLESAAANPWTLGFWATFMLLSTLLPTAAHAAVALFSALPCAGRESWREKLKDKIDSGIEANYLLPALYFSFWWVVSVGLVGLAGWGVSWLLVTGDVPVAETLLKLARWSLELSGAPVP